MTMGSKDNRLLILVLVMIGVCLLVSAANRGFFWDEAHHANPALFIYNVIKDQPTDIVNYSVSYHSHYKFFAVLASYPPMNALCVSGIYSLLGPSILTTRIFAIIESLIMLFFVFKLAKLYSRGNRYMPILCVILTALHPVVFLFSSSNALDIGLTLFLVASMYFFTMFLKTEQKRYLYYTAISIGLGVITKIPMVLVFVPLLLTMIWERKIYLFREQGKNFIKALLIFIVFISPLIIQLGVLHSAGISDVFLGHWNRPSGTNIPESLLITNPEIVQNSLGVIFSQWFLVPFFVLGLILLLRKRMVIDKLFLLSMAFFFWFYTSNIIANMPDPRFLLPIVPLVVITAFYALVNIGEWIGGRWLKTVVVGVIILLAAAQSYSYLGANPFYDIPNLDKAASFIIENTEEPTTVLTTWGQPQMFEFARLDTERKIYVMYMPEKQENIARAINGDFSYYQSAELWEEFGVEHPNPDYVILHEKALRNKNSYDYGINYLENNKEFKLLNIIEGNEPYNRIFIYKIIH